LTTNFPAQIDSFPIHVPQEIITSISINNVQDSIVAVEVFCKSLDQLLKSHINQVSSAHLASSIALDGPINGTTNVFAALQNIDSEIKTHITQAIGAHAATAISITSIPSLSGTNVQVALANLQAQFNTLLTIESSSNVPNTLVLRDAYGNFAAGTITAALSGNVTGNVTGNVSGSAATFTGPLLGDVTGTQGATVVSTVGTSTAANVHLAELLANAATNLNTASTIVKRDSSGNFTAGTITAALTGNATTASTATNVAQGALLGIDGYVVGTESVQILENKTIISDFSGSKILLFTSTVIEQEESIYNSSSPSANQLEVRQQAVSLITAVNQGLSQVTVSNGAFFANVAGVTNGVQFVIPNITTLAPIKVISIAGNVLQLDTAVWLPTYASVDTTANAGWVLINKPKAAPLFYVGYDGYVFASQLTVANSTFSNVTLNENVSITGTLSVTGLTTLSSGLAVTNGLTVSGLSAVGALTTGSIVTTGAITTTGSITSGSAIIANGALTVGGSATFDQNVHVIGNEVVDGYLNVVSNGTFGGAVVVGGSISSSAGVFTGGALTATLPSVFKSDLTVDGNLHVKQNTQLDGYLNVSNNTTIGGDLLVVGTVTTVATILTLIDGSISQPVTGLNFNTTVRSAFINYTIYRQYASPVTELASVGELRLVSKNSPQSWQLDDTYAGDNVGVIFSINSSGQVLYTSTFIGAPISFKMTFRKVSTFDV